MQILILDFFAFSHGTKTDFCGSKPLWRHVQLSKTIILKFLSIKIKQTNHKISLRLTFLLLCSRKRKKSWWKIFIFLTKYKRVWKIIFLLHLHQGMPIFGSPRLFKEWPAEYIFLTWCIWWQPKLKKK